MRIRIREILQSQDGSVLPVVVIFLPVLLLGLAVLWDWSRVQIQWRGLQTAADAAAQNAALSGDRYSQLHITRIKRHWYSYQDCWTDAKGNEHCRTVWDWYPEQDDIPEMVGLDRDLFAAGGWGPRGWKTRADCANWDLECSYRINDRWVRYDRGRMTQAARAAFDANAAAMGAGSQGFAWKLDSVTVTDDFGQARRIPPEPGWCSRVLEEDTVRIEASGTTQFGLLPSFGGRAAQSYRAWSEFRGWWPGVTSPPHPPDRPEVWRGTWDRVCR